MFGNNETSGIWMTLFMFIIKSQCNATMQTRVQAFDNVNWFFIGHNWSSVSAHKVA